jgi:hypothetical protein
MSYDDLTLLPCINGVTVYGDKKFEDYGLIPLNSDEITALELEVFGYVL